MTGTSLVGVGMPRFGVHDRPLAELFAEAAFPALDDAGIGDAVALAGVVASDDRAAPRFE